MPIGCVSCVPHVMARLAAQRPRTVLDLGIGFGFYGAAIRQWLDGGVRPWGTRLLGVEAWRPYRNPAWSLYNRVFVEPIEDHLARVPAGPSDAILLMDVLEHFSAEAGRDVIARAVRALAPGGQLIVGTPAVWVEQGDVHGNPFERHRSLWDVGGLEALGFALITDGSPDPWGNRMLLAARGD